jgi:dTDP-4-dehydrorhamnose reductase
MKILLTGANGQVGHELLRSLQVLGEVVAPRRSELDLANPLALRAFVRELGPDLIVNPAAYTAVDQAETDIDQARLINAEAPAVLAEEAQRCGAALVHYSTDYVFDGTGSSPFAEGDAPAPLNVYGQTKLEGELAIAASGAAHLIVRTSWVYSLHGRNFLLTMLKLGQERDELRVVADQHGAPTWSRTIADATAGLLARAHAGGQGWWEEHGGIVHLAGQGETTWCGFTEAIIRLAGLPCRVTPITTAEFPKPARRPANSRLDCSRIQALGIHLPHWETALRLCLER